MPKFSHPCIYQTKLKISTSFFPFHTKKGEKIIKAARTHSLANSLTDNLLTKEFNSQKRKEKKNKKENSTLVLEYLILFNNKTKPGNHSRPMSLTLLWH